MPDAAKPVPAMPYTVREVVVGPGDGKRVYCREDNGAYLTDDEVKVLEYVQWLESQVGGPDHVWMHAACLTIAETGQKWGDNITPSPAMQAVYRLRQENEALKAEVARQAANGSIVPPEAKSDAPAPKKGKAGKS